MRASYCGYIDVVQKLLTDGAQLDLQTEVRHTINYVVPIDNKVTLHF